jgi:hypothetical protein
MILVVIPFERAFQDRTISVVEPEPQVFALAEPDLDPDPTSNGIQGHKIKN